jgi:hypothetical protein
LSLPRSLIETPPRESSPGLRSLFFDVLVRPAGEAFGLILVSHGCFLGAETGTVVLRLFGDLVLLSVGYSGPRLYQSPHLPRLLELVVWSFLFQSLVERLPLALLLGRRAESLGGLRLISGGKQPLLRVPGFLFSWSGTPVVRDAFVLRRIFDRCAGAFLVHAAVLPGSRERMPEARASLRGQFGLRRETMKIHK